MLNRWYECHCEVNLNIHMKVGRTKENLRTYELLVPMRPWYCLSTFLRDTDLSIITMPEDNPTRVI